MVWFHPRVCREIYHNALCVIGLWIMMIGFHIIADRLDRSVVLGSIVGSAASLLNFALYMMTVQIAEKGDPTKARPIVRASKVLRAFLMGFVAFIILLFPALHVTTGIIALFFANIRYWVLRIKQT